MYILKQYIKEKYKKLFNEDLRLYLKESKILDDALYISKSKKELRKNTYKLGDLINQEINQFIYDKIYYKKNSLNKLKKIIKINNNKIILFYYKFFIFKGWLVDSYFLRKIYLKQIKNKKLNYFNIIENNNLKLQRKFYNNIKKKALVNWQLKKIFFNKNVAIVGPALSGDKNGKKIDKYDIIVRINQIDQLNLSHKSKGKRTDVIFLNGTKSEEIIKQKKMSFIKKAKAVIFKTDGYVKFFKRLGLLNSYKSTNIDRYMMVGISNMLPYILFQILAHNPKSVKIFDNDFLVNPKRVKNYYKYNLDKKPKFLSIIFLHDPLSQFNFVKLLYNASGIVKGDSKFTKVIKLDQKEFLGKLEKSNGLN